ncbi:Gfo/Idh/MocA family protein [Gandjariella thermophila]|uniref:Oxidoreductase n=1 Tax=Gandjariella thermophila TaxID=1931992 RepID=A0A4D4JBJ6_9PSEU|nr:Gfo/Idh/MocA family oxidoreductase [Gandjariella thermophila]GDY32038.1 oxidoreductase [Gandjariella thermophila]
MPSRETTRVAVVGYGYWGAKHVRVLCGLPEVEVTVVDQRPERLDEARRQFPTATTAGDLAEVLDHVDAVVVATPPTTHAQVALHALGAGRPTLVEKPLATSVEDAQAMVAAAAERDAVLMVGHTFEYNAAVWKLKEIIASGELGSVLHIDSARLNLGIYQSDVNVVWDLAPHDLSIISFLLDDMPSSVSAWAHHDLGHQHVDVAYLALDFERIGTRAFVRVSWLNPNKVRSVTVVGDRKMAVYDDLSEIDRIRVYDRGVQPKAAVGLHLTGGPVGYRTGDVVSPHVAFREPLLVQDSHFVECVRTGRRPDTPGERGLDIVRILSALDHARLTGHAVPIDWHDADRPLPARLADAAPVLAGVVLNGEVAS